MKRPAVILSVPNLTRSRLACKIWANGEFTVGLDSSKKLPLEQRPQPEPVENMFWQMLDDETKTWCRNNVIERMPDLDLTVPANSPRRVRGLNGITSYGARMVRNACHLMQSKYGVSQLGFVTLTLPRMSVDDLQSVGRNWSEILKGFFKSMGRLYERRTGNAFTYVAVTEVQTKRWKTRHELGLHIHYVFRGRLYSPGPWFIKHYEIRNQWESSVSRYCAQDYDFDSSENCKAVRKDASKYLSKYMSKGSAIIREIEASRYSGCLPRSWYSLTRRLAHAIKRGIRTSYPIAGAIIRRIRKLKDDGIVDYIGVVDIPTKAYGDRILGIFGRFSEEICVLSTGEILEKINSS